MSYPRFFCDSPLESHETLTLPTSVSHHIRVRRLRAGQQIVLFNGAGIELTCTLDFEKSGQAVAQVNAIERVERELPYRLTLVQGMASQDRMDWVVEKAVELGADCVLPVAASRSVVKLSGERAAKRVAHWQKLVIAASEQCGRNRLMQVHTPCSIEQAIATVRAQPMLLCHLAPQTLQLNDPKLLTAVRAAKAAYIIVGPEGGWDNQEAQHWLSAGALPVSLGERTLRTETAGLAAIAGLAQIL